MLRAAGRGRKDAASFRYARVPMQRGFTAPAGCASAPLRIKMSTPAARQACVAVARRGGRSRSRLPLSCATIRRDIAGDALLLAERAGAAAMFYQVRYEPNSASRRFLSCQRRLRHQTHHLFEKRRADVQYR